MNKILHKIIVVATTLVVAVSIFGIVPAAVQAQGANRVVIPATPEVTTITDISAIHRIVTGLIDWLFVFFFAIAVAFVLMAAFLYLTDPGGKGAEAGKKKLQAAAVAVVIGLLARGLPALIQSIITPPPTT